VAVPPIVPLEELLDLLGDVQAVHLDWKRRMGRGQVAVQASYSELVEGSKLIRHFETAVVPGLLQTSEHARCIAIEAASIHSTDDDPDQVVAAKLQRQRFLYDSTKQFEFLMAEPVLRWLPCPPTVMRAQLDRGRRGRRRPTTHHPRSGRAVPTLTPADMATTWPTCWST
jgi:Domain of unknown function (DUF5753)